jgi:hypothetical protein
MTFFFTKEESEKKIELLFSYDEYFPHDITMGTVFLVIHFKDVENIFHDVYINHLNVDFGHDANFSPTFKKGFYYNTLTDNEKYVLENTQVYNDSTFLRVKPVLQKMIDAALSFLNQHTTLQSYYNLGETMSIAEQAKYYGQPLPQRKLIIKKLLNISDYNSYANDLIVYYTQENNLVEANFIQDLKNQLDNM